MIEIVLGSSSIEPTNLEIIQKEVVVETKVHIESPTKAQSESEDIGSLSMPTLG